MAKRKKNGTTQPASKDALRVGEGIVSFLTEDFLKLRVGANGEVTLGDTPVNIEPLPPADIQLLSEYVSTQTLH